MASKYDKKQGIDGIATLTNDTLAIQNIRNAKKTVSQKADKKQK